MALIKPASRGMSSGTTGMATMSYQVRSARAVRYSSPEAKARSRPVAEASVNGTKGAVARSA